MLSTKIKHCVIVSILFIFSIKLQFIQFFFLSFRVRDSCILLNLSNAPAMLLKETLKCQEGFETKNNALEELGVYSLTPSQALVILAQRNYANL